MQNVVRNFAALLGLSPSGAMQRVWHCVWSRQGSEREYWGTLNVEKNQGNTEGSQEGEEAGEKGQKSGG
jgi:hypothetical protein